MKCPGCGTQMLRHNADTFDFLECPSCGHQEHPQAYLLRAGIYAALIVLALIVALALWPWGGAYANP